MYPATGRFNTITDAREWMETFVYWYNHEHLHSAIKFVTPNQRHTVADKKILQNRQRVYEEAKSRTPNRWFTGKTRNWEHEGVVRLNPGRIKTASTKAS